MNHLPIELLELILLQIPNSLYLCAVCKKWYAAVLNTKKLTTGANGITQNLGLSNVLIKFPSLQHLVVNHGNEYQIHHFVSEFCGSRTITHIESISDFIIYGAMNCPRLISLSFPSYQVSVASTIVSNEMLEKHRDIAFILSSIPTLKYLRLDFPNFCLTSSMPRIAPQLEWLVITSVDSGVLGALSAAFSNGYELPKLKTLYADLDMGKFPPDFVNNLALACPGLENLKIRYSDLGSDFLASLCSKMPKLKSFKLTRCRIPFPDSNWFSLVETLSTHMSLLFSLSFKYCTIVEGSAFIIRNSQESHHQLNQLKIFDITNQRTVDFTALEYYPSLKCLRVDTNVDCFWGPESKVKACWLKNLRLLELRLDCQFEMSISNPADLFLPNLESLSISGYCRFPSFIVLPNASRLKNLQLKYARAPIPEDIKVELPMLEGLSIWGLTEIADQICLKTLSMLTKNSPNLKSFSMSAIQSKCSTFDPEIFKRFTLNCPKLSSFKTINVRLDRGCCKQLIESWKVLNSLSIKGNSAIEVITAEFENEFLFPIIRGHPYLTSLSLTVEDIQVCPSENEDYINKCDSYEAKLKSLYPSCTFKIRAPFQNRSYTQI